MFRVTAGLAALMLMVPGVSAAAHQSVDTSPVPLPAGPVSAPTAAPTPATPPTPTAPQDPSYEGYILGPHDTINVSIVGRADYGAQAQVQEDGTITLPLIGPLPASGQSLLQLKADIEKRLKAGGYFRQPEVSIVLAAASSRYATILGDVTSSGLVALDRQYHLSELIARAGGVRSGSDAVSVTLPDGSIAQYSLRAIISNTSPDPIVIAGSKIFVRPAPIFYVYGQVGSAGGVAVEPEMTLRNAIARAGGPSQLGTVKKIKLYRGDTIINKPPMALRIEPGDTIYVGELIF
jgi:polysaccharide export outer membrane protein